MTCSTENLKLVTKALYMKAIHGEKAKRAVRNFLKIRLFLSGNCIATPIEFNPSPTRIWYGFVSKSSSHRKICGSFETLQQRNYLPCSSNTYHAASVSPDIAFSKMQAPWFMQQLTNSPQTVGVLNSPHYYLWNRQQNTLYASLASLNQSQL